MISNHALKKQLVRKHDEIVGYSQLIIPLERRFFEIEKTIDFLIEDFNLLRNCLVTSNPDLQSIRPELYRMSVIKEKK